MPGAGPERREARPAVPRPTVRTAASARAGSFLVPLELADLAERQEHHRRQPECRHDDCRERHGWRLEREERDDQRHPVDAEHEGLTDRVARQHDNRPDDARQDDGDALEDVVQAASRSSSTFRRQSPSVLIRPLRSVTCTMTGPASTSSTPVASALFPMTDNDSRTSIESEIRNTPKLLTET